MRKKRGRVLSTIISTILLLVLCSIQVMPYVTLRAEEVVTEEETGELDVLDEVIEESEIIIEETEKDVDETQYDTETSFADGNECVEEVSDTMDKSHKGTASPLLNEGAEALVTGLDVTDMADGIAPFDGDDNAGNDSSANNRIVRSFDTITYTLTYTTNMKNGVSGSISEANLYIEFILPVSSEVATFDTESMPWLINGKVSESGGQQILTGYREIPRENGSAIPGSGTLSVILKVWGAAHGDIIQPVFTAYLDGSEQSEYQTVYSEAITVSAAPKYNIQIDRNMELTYKDSFDFTTGNDSAPSKNIGSVEGRMYGYGITIQLFNDNASKGLKGIEIPSGDITFNLELTMNENNVDITNDSTPLLWDYMLNNQKNSGNHGRNMLWGNISNTRYAVFVAPYATGSDFRSIYNKPGDFYAEQSGNIISVTLSGYDFNSFQFPTHNAGRGAASVPNYEEHIGSFSAGYFQILSQFPDTWSASSNYHLTVTAKDLAASSKSGQTMSFSDNSQMDMRKGDDATTVQVLKTLTGTYSKRNFLTETSASAPNSTTYLHSGLNNGDTWYYRGGAIKIWGGIFVSTTNDAETEVYGVNLLQKFDDEVFEIPAGSTKTSFSKSGSSTMSYRVLYAAKSDKSGWNNEAEMSGAREEDLVYFETIDELTQAGYTCVAVLFEGRDGVIASGASPYWGVNVNIKETAKVGEVYQTVNVARIWMSDNAPDRNASRIDNSIDSYPYTRQLTVNYEKTVYNEDGSTSGHTNSYPGGQSLLIVDYISNIEKSISQQSGGINKDIFDLDAAQRYVDFTLKPNVSMANGKQPSVPPVTEVKITDLLPEGLHYVENSSVIGGIYDIENQVVYGGTHYEPEITSNSDGTTTLVWKFDDIQVGMAMDQINFSCFIGDMEDPEKDAKNNDTFVNNAIIQAGGDSRAILDVNGNTANAGLKVSKLTATSIIKRVVQEKNEVGADITYHILFSNTSTSPIKEFTLLDILPYNGDGRGTNYDGTYNIQDIEINTVSSNGISGMGLNVRYTSDTAVRSKGAETVDVSSFNTAGKTVVDAQTQRFAVNGNPTAIAVTGDLGAYASITVKVTLKVSDNKPADTYANNATVHAPQGFAGQVTAPTVEAYVVARAIEGVVWVDNNEDGRHDDNEKRIPGVRVRLYDELNNEVIRNILGESYGQVYTDENGAYRFELLPPGAYTIVFESSDTVDLMVYDVTIQHASGVDSSEDSDAEGVYTTISEETLLEKGIIKNISFPALSDLEPEDYQISHMDMGLTIPVTFTKSADPDVNSRVKAGSIITYYLTAEIKARGLTGVVISDRIPDGLTLVSGSIQYKKPDGPVVSVDDSAYDESERTIIWPELDLEKGETVASFQVTVDPLEDGEYAKKYLNHGQMNRPGKVPEEYPPTEEVPHDQWTREADIHKTAALIEEDKVLSEDRGTESKPVETALGQTIEYRITVKNKGADEIKSGNLTVTDLLPEGTSYVADSMKAEFGGISDPTGILESKLIKNETLTWIIKNLSNGEEAYLIFRVTAPVTSDDPDTEEFEESHIFTNTAELYDEDNEENSKSETTYHIVREDKPVDPELVSLTVEAAKQLTGRKLISDEFSFDIKDEKGNTITNGKNDETGTIIFEKELKFTKPGTYHYYITELIPDGSDASNIKYDETTFKVSVVVTLSDTDNKLQITETTYWTIDIEGNEKSESEIVFHNTFIPETIIYAPGIKKTVTGINPEKEDFSFTLRGVSTNDDIAALPPMPAGTTEGKKVITISGEGMAVFGNITYDSVGIYTYEITEIPGSSIHYTYDDTRYTLKVLVTADPDTGELKLTYAAASDEVTKTEIEFTNLYEKKKIPYAVTGSKILYGRELKAEEFRFEVYDADMNLVTTGTNDADGNLIFKDEITVAEEGIYIYRVQEAAGISKEVTYDEAIYEMRITVVYNRTSKTLDVETISYTRIGVDDEREEAAGIVFENTYTPTPLPGTCEPQIKKTIIGADAEEETFQFLLTGISIDDDFTRVPPMPARSTDGQKERSITGAGNVSFGQIRYEKVGIYTYQITEKAGNNIHYQYDQTKYLLTVIVTADSENGDLTADYTVSADGVSGKEIEFINIYEKKIYQPDPITFTPEAVKELTGRTQKDGEFTFTIHDRDGKEVTTGKNNAEGKIIFEDQLTFESEGIYTYIVSEKTGTLPGVTYDPATFQISLKVAANSESGNLEIADITYQQLGTDDEKTEANEIIFRNTYEAEPATYEPEITKVVSGKDPAEETFHFLLQGVDTAPMPEGSQDVRKEISLKGAGIASFGEIQYEAPGVYTYQITEKPGQSIHYTYDTSAYVLIVTVTDDTASGSLKAKAEISKGKEKTKEIIFTNSYDAKAVSFFPEVKKVLIGRTLKVEEFSFEIHNEHGDLLTTGNNNQEGSVLFDEPLYFTEEGIYTYQITEIKGKDESIIYDTSIFSVTVKISSNPETKELEVEDIIYAKNQKDEEDITEETIVFQNQYVEEETDKPTPEADIQLKKSTSKEMVNGNDEITYTIEVQHIGDATPVTDIVVTDYVPENTTFVSVNDGGIYDVDDGREYVYWAIGTLNKKESVLLSFTVRVDECVESGTVIRNTAFAQTGDTTDKTYSNEVTNPVKTQTAAAIKTSASDKTTPSRVSAKSSVKTGDAIAEAYIYLILMLIGIAGVIWIRRKGS